jgi:transposase
MSWTETTRRDHARAGLRYASDLTDAEWRLVVPLLPKRSRWGRPPVVDLRVVLEALLYMASTGCQWRALLKDFPPRSTVQGYFYRWQRGLAGDRRRARRSGASFGWARCRAHGLHHRQPERADHRERRPARVGCGQEGEGAQTAHRGTVGISVCGRA